MTKLSKKTFEPLSDIQKMNQVRPATELARTLASIDAPAAQTLRDVTKSFSADSDLMKRTQSAADIARRLTRQPDVVVRLTEAIDLNLPNTTATIQASLPRHLADISAPAADQTFVATQKANVETVGKTDVQLESVEDLGRMVRRSRERQRLSQQEFADLAGVGRRFVSELENGKPTLELAKVLKVAHAAGISLIARDRLG